MKTFGSFAIFMCAAILLSAQERQYLAGEVANGMRLYQGNCTGCHGPEGDGIAGVNFSAGRYRRAASDDDIVRIIVGGIPGTPMPPSNFSDGQAGTIVAYLRSMSTEGETQSRGDAVRGRSLFEAKGQCQTCHSVAGRGSRTGPSLTEIGAVRRAVEIERSILDPDQEIRSENRTIRIVMRDGSTLTGRLFNQDTFSLQLLDEKEHLRSIDKANTRDVTLLRTSPMPSYRDRLSADEVADIVSYLRSLRGRP